MATRNDGDCRIGNGGMPTDCFPLVPRGRNDGSIFGGEGGEKEAGDVSAITENW